jgi:hypothetical protein
MSVHQWARLAAVAREHLPWRSASRVLAIIALAATASGCAAPAGAPLAGANPADPHASAPAVRYRSTIGPYLRERPAAPAPWLERNEQVAPRGRS